MVLNWSEKGLKRIYKKAWAPCFSINCKISPEKQNYQIHAAFLFFAHRVLFEEIQEVT